MPNGAAKKYLCPKTTYKFASVWKIIMYIVHLNEGLPDFSATLNYSTSLSKMVLDRTNSNIFEL